MVLDATLLNTQQYKVSVKRSNPGKVVAPSPTPRCSSYRKGSLQVTLDYGRQLYWQIHPTKPKHYCIERAAAGIGPHVNAHKTGYMCYNQSGKISTRDGTFLKMVDKFTYLGSSVSSTEKEIDTRLKKAWTAIDRLSIIWKSDLTDKIKRSFF